MAQGLGSYANHGPFCHVSSDCLEFGLRTCDFELKNYKSWDLKNQEQPLQLLTLRGFLLRYSGCGVVPVPNLEAT